MVPAQAPLPTDCRFPFQADSGSQTSILISESVEGVSVAATRQNDGRFLNDWGCFPLGAGKGDVNAPAATSSATVMAVFFSLSDVRLWHVEAPETGAMPIATSVNRNVNRVRIGRVMVAAP